LRVLAEVFEREHTRASGKSKGGGLGWGGEGRGYPLKSGKERSWGGSQKRGGRVFKARGTDVTQQFGGAGKNFERKRKQGQSGKARGKRGGRGEGVVDTAKIKEQGRKSGH